MKLASHIKPNIFSEELQMEATRNGYGRGLKMAGELDPSIIVLSADLTESTRTHFFQEAFPDRFIQCGIAEQNMASVASGLAAMGKIPFISSYAMFSPGRNWEQIRTTIAYNNVNVKIIGAHAGVSVGPDGATHQAIEDMAIMRVMPNMVVLAPCDINEAQAAALWASKYVGPVYIRLGREKTPVITKEDSKFEFGKASVLAFKNNTHRDSVGIITTGILANEALKAAYELDAQGIGASVMHLGTVKPLDTEAVERFSAEHDFIVTLEEHQMVGGLGSAIAEHLSSTRPARIVRLGIDDQFGQSGTLSELISYYKIDSKAVVSAVKEVFAQ